MLLLVFLLYGYTRHLTAHPDTFIQTHTDPLEMMQ